MSRIVKSAHECSKFRVIAYDDIPFRSDARPEQQAKRHAWLRTPERGIEAEKDEARPPRGLATSGAEQSS
jgi:hypothetical protein